jgi:xanthine dehydrogenase accessory factor
MTINQQHHILAELMEAQRSNQPVALATVVKASGSVPRHAGSKMLIYADGRQSGTIGGGEMESRVVATAAQALQTGQGQLVTHSLVDPKAGDPGVCGGTMTIFVEPYLPPPTVLIVGCGHVGQALAQLAHWLGFRVAATDDRVELVNATHMPDVDIYLPGSMADALAQYSVTPNTFVAVVTRNVLVDRDVLPLLVQTDARFIGVMGSRRRWAHTRKLLLEDGLTSEQLARFHSPLGLELQAETPREIAVSIMAEIMQIQRGASGARMSDGGVAASAES